MDDSAQRDRLGALLARICSIPSVTGAEGPLADEIELFCRALPGEVHRVGNSVALFLDSGPRGKKPHLLLAGHIDTVPPSAGDRSGPTVDEGRLISRGASDMKGGVAVMMALAERWAELRRGCRLSMAFYAAEEGPYAENELEPLLTAAPELTGADAAIMLEPSNNKPQLGCLGTMHAKLTLRGRAAHSARPWQGQNAIAMALPLLRAIAGWPVRDVALEGCLFKEVLTATLIEGGSARNVVPESCSINVNFRFGPDRSSGEAAGVVEKLAADHGAEFELCDMAPPAPPSASQPILRELCALAPGASAKQAWTDVGRMAEHGIPAMNFGPGDPATAHQPGEWIALEAVLDCYRLLERLLEKSW